MALQSFFAGTLRVDSVSPPQLSATKTTRVGVFSHENLMRVWLSSDHECRKAPFDALFERHLF